MYRIHSLTFLNPLLALSIPQGISASFVGPTGGDYAAPVPRQTAGTVRAKILMSSQSDHLSMYCRSSSIHSSNGIEFRPFTCHRHVMPGLTLNRRLCVSVLNC